MTAVAAFWLLAASGFGAMAVFFALHAITYGFEAIAMVILAMKLADRDRKKKEKTT